MRSFTLVLSLMAILSQTACSNTLMPTQAAQPLRAIPLQAQPVRLNPVQNSLQMVPAQVSLGLKGEELELSGIYRADARGATLVLRNGQELRLLNLNLQPMNVLPGIPDRMQVRVRGVLRPTGEMMIQQHLALQVAGVSRI